MLPKMAESGFHWLRHKLNREFTIAHYLPQIGWRYADCGESITKDRWDYWAPCVPPDRPVMPANLAQYMFWLGKEGEAENAV